jgi:hypothetical protein
MWIAVLALALQQQATPLTARDTAAIQKAARDQRKYDAPVAQLVGVRGDTVSVHLGDHISWTLVHVVRKKDQWVAVKDTIEVRGIR